MIFNEALYNRLRSRLHADIQKLTDELIEQPALMQDAVEAASDAIQIRDAAKNALATVIANASNRIRESDFGGKAPSVEKVKSLVEVDEAVIAATEELEEAKHSAAYWIGLVDSFGERGSSLRRVAELTVSGYLTPNTAYERNREELAAGRVKFRQRGT